MNRRAYPTDLTDSEWERIPSAERKRKHSLREVVNALFYQVRGGASWRMLPHDFPPWETVYGFFSRWSKQGVLQRVHDTIREQTRVQEGREPTPSVRFQHSPHGRLPAVRPGPCDQVPG